MKPFNRFFIVAALLAASTSASATDYYLRGEVNKYTGYNVIYKFTDVTSVAKTGYPTYQLTLESLSGPFKIGGESTVIEDEQDYWNNTTLVNEVQVTGWDEINLGADDANTLSFDSPVTLTSHEDTSVSANNVSLTDYYVEHVVLTLIDKQDGTYELKLEKATNESIYKGVPSFLYVVNSDGRLYPEYRLIKGDGDNYTVYFDHFGGSELTIADRKSDDTPCINLKVEYSTTFYPTNDGKNMELSQKSQSFVNGGDAINKTVNYDLENGTFDLDLYQSAWGGYKWTIWDGGLLYGLTFNFKYDISTNEKSKDSGYSEFEKTADKIYNGVLTVGYDVSASAFDEETTSIDVDHFYVKSSEFDGWATEKAMTRDTNSDYTDANGDQYQVYTLDIPGDFDGAFYILDNIITYTQTTTTSDGVQAASEDDSSATTTTITTSSKDVTYKGSASDKDVVYGYDVLPETTTSADEPSAASDGDEESTSSSTTTDKVATNIVDFKTFGDVKATDTTSAGIPFYAISSGGAQIVFKYNVNDPSKSIVQYIAADGTVSTLTGSEDITLIAPNEGVTEYYNLNGIRINGEPTAPGLYIRRAGNKATKVIIRQTHTIKNLTV